MCGIFGILGEERGTVPLAQRVLDALRHRGPDDHGVHAFPEGLLAHTRLSIIDLSALGRQPMANAAGTCWIVYNGEIYNYVELRRELEGYPFRTQTDTEVILAAYDRWGMDCLRRLRGMFAFGLWDGARKRLVCATDRFSIKPLYYAGDGRRFIFSSEIKPLGLAGTPLRPNLRTLYDYLAWGLLDHGEETLFEGVRQLRGGTALIVEDGRVEVRPYWRLDGQGEPPEDGAPSASREDVERLLIESVRLHLRGDVEVGLSLSSGLDSNVLQLLALDAGGRTGPLECFTYAFPGTPYDEWERSRPLRADDRCAFHAVEVEPDSLLDGLRTLVAIMEEPVGGLGIYGYWRNAACAAQRGIKVLLDGQGADEVFAGYRYYYEARLRQLWDLGLREQARREFRQFADAHGEPERSMEELVAPRNGPDVVRAPDGTSLAGQYVSAEFGASLAGRTPVFPRPFRCAVKNAMYQDLCFLKIPKLLRFQDKCAMAWGVEVRVPYLDHRLVERLFAVPASELLEGGLTKALLRAIARRRGATEGLEGPKLYVAAPQREWIKTVLRPAIRELIHDAVLVREGYVDRDQLLRQFDEYAASPHLGNSFFIWKFLNAELWYQAFCALRPVGLMAG